MSFILDALQKLEDQRRRRETITREPVRRPRPRPRAPRRRAWPWLIGGALLMNAALLIVLAWPARSPERDSAERPEPPTAVAQSRLPAPAAVPDDRPVALPPRDRDAQVSARADTPATPSPPPARRSTGAAATSELRAEPPARPVRQGVAAPPPPAASRAETAAADRSRDQQPGRATTTDSPAAVPARPRNEGDRAAPAPRASVVPDSAVTPKDAMAKLRLNVLVYSEGEGDPLVFINNQKYVVGQRVDGKFLIERITQEGALLSYEGQRFLLRQ